MVDIKNISKFAAETLLKKKQTSSVFASIYWQLWYLDLYLKARTSATKWHKWEWHKWENDTNEKNKNSVTTFLGAKEFLRFRAVMVSQGRSYYTTSFFLDFHNTTVKGKFGIFSSHWCFSELRDILSYESSPTM